MHTAPKTRSALHTTLKTRKRVAHDTRDTKRVAHGTKNEEARCTGRSTATRPDLNPSRNTHRSMPLHCIRVMPRPVLRLTLHRCLPLHCRAAGPLAGTLPHRHRRWPMPRCEGEMNRKKICARLPSTSTFPRSRRVKILDGRKLGRYSSLVVTATPSLAWQSSVAHPPNVGSLELTDLS